MQAQPAIDPPEEVTRIARAKRSARVPSRASAIIAAVKADDNAPVQWPPVISDALRDLTYKQRRFVIGVASGLPKYRAYLDAYDVAQDRPHAELNVDANTVLANPKVRGAIDLIVDWVSRDWLFDAKDACEVHLLRLDEESQHAPRAEARIAASVAILKAHGAFISRSEVRHVHELAAPVQELMSSFLDLIGTAVPITTEPRQLADVATIDVTFDASDGQ